MQIVQDQRTKAAAAEIPCLECDKTFTHLRGLKRHKEHFHEDSSPQCPTCWKVVRRDRLMLHMSKCCKKLCRQRHKSHSSKKRTTQEAATTACSGTMALQWQPVQSSDCGLQVASASSKAPAIQVKARVLSTSIYDLHIALLRRMRDHIVECNGWIHMTQLREIMHDLTEHNTCLYEINGFCEGDLGFSLVAVAAFVEDIVMCRRLIEAGGNVNYHGPFCPVWYTTAMKATALHVATKMKSLPLVKLLIDHGADIDLRMSCGDTAYDLTRDWRSAIGDSSKSIEESLRSKGACGNIVTKG